MIDALNFFRNLVFPNLWLTFGIEPITTAALISAGGSILGGAASGGLFGGGEDGPDMFDIRRGALRNKSDILFGGTFGPNNTLVPGAGISTPFSALDAGTGGITIDPMARQLGLDAFDNFSGALGGTRSALLGNANAFERARVNPLLEQIAVGRAGRERELGRTGVRGTFRNRSLQDFDIAGERALGDARSIAAQDTINAVNTLDQMLFNAGTGTGTNLFNQELKQLGLGLETINVINSLANNLAVGAGSIAATSAGNAALIDQARTENVTAAIGAGLSSFGDIFGGSRTPAPIQEGPTNPPAIGLNP